MTITPKRCAIYTRKSSEEGLEQEFNSLHAQREACEAYIKSQKHEGWQAIKTVYDDGGISGGTMERPALKQLLTDIKNHKVNIIVVYKVDRLTRSLADFAKMVEIFDAHNVSFVSVTQQFNTTSSMGRLTLNVLLSFAQFEREVTGERIRDKIAASKQRGIWMGGNVPLGYEVKNRHLLIKEKDAELTRNIYQWYLEQGCMRLLYKHLISRDIRSINGFIISRGTLYKMLSNPIYIGQIRHKGVCYPGQHTGIIDQKLWDQVQQHIAGNRIGMKKQSRKTEPSPLARKIFDQFGGPLRQVHAKKRGRRYRYYISERLLVNPKDDAMTGWRLPASELEKTVSQVALSLLNNRELITETLCASNIIPQYLPAALKAASDLDNTSIMGKFLDRVELKPDGISITLSLSPLIPKTDNPIKLTHEFPMLMKRRGVEMRMVIGDLSSVNIDQTLIKTIVRAHGWFQELVSGKVKNLAEICVRENVDKGYLSRIINLAFLAPDIVEAIIAGRQPPELTSHKLLRTADLPKDWREQRRILGFIR